MARELFRTRPFRAKLWRSEYKEQSWLLSAVTWQKHSVLHPVNIPQCHIIMNQTWGNPPITFMRRLWKHFLWPSASGTFSQICIDIFSIFASFNTKRDWSKAHHVTPITCKCQLRHSPQWFPNWSSKRRTYAIFYASIQIYKFTQYIGTV